MKSRSSSSRSGCSATGRLRKYITSTRVICPPLLIASSLDSRQRKKQHTERLEEEKKIHSNIIQELEDKLAEMSIQKDQMIQQINRDREFLASKVDILQMEKEEMMRAHTLESGELRKKNTFLQEKLHQMQDTLDRASLSSNTDAGFSAAFDFENEFDLDNDCWTEPLMHTVPAIKTEKVASISESEKPAAPGLLLILLLCGAFVASSKTATASLPPLPKTLQTASASVLQNIFQDAGVAEVGRVENMDAITTTDSWAVAKSDRMIGLESTMNVINSFEKATPEQQREQFMQLTPAEYNEVTSNNYRDAEPVNRSRRRIQENLASMRNSKQSAAEVYTRSLLWDRVDVEVVRRFAAFARHAQSSTASGNEESGGAAAHS